MSESFRTRVRWLATALSSSNSGAQRILACWRVSPASANRARACGGGPHVSARADTRTGPLEHSTDLIKPCNSRDVLRRVERSLPSLRGQHWRRSVGAEIRDGVPERDGAAVLNGTGDEGLQVNLRRVVLVRVLSAHVTSVSHAREPREDATHTKILDQIVCPRACLRSQSDTD